MLFRSTLMETPDDFTGPVNLGNPAEMTMLELAQQILRITGSQSEMVFKPLPGDDPRQRRPDIGLAASALQWKPSTELEAGLRATVDYFRELL